MQAAYAKSLHTISLADIESESSILAPPARQQPGRPQKKHKAKRNRYDKSAKDLCCSYYNEWGHNITTCLRNPDEIYRLWKPVDSAIDVPIFIPKD